MSPLAFMRWRVRPYMIHGHHHERQPKSCERLLHRLSQRCLQDPNGEQQDDPLWCHSCFCIVAIVIDVVNVEVGLLK